LQIGRELLDQKLGAPGARDNLRASQMLSGSLTVAQLTKAGRDGIKDLIAGLVAAVVLIGNIVSFGALMFPGDLSSGIPIVIWAMLIGSCVGGSWIAAATSLPPLASGIIHQPEPCLCFSALPPALMSSLRAVRPIRLFRP
jgi:hypothetical protein